MLVKRLGIVGKSFLHLLGKSNEKGCSEVCVIEDVASLEETWIPVPAITGITVSVVGLPLADVLINVAHNFSEICSLSPPVHLTGGSSAVPESPARRKLQAVPYTDDVA